MRQSKRILTCCSACFQWFYTLSKATMTNQTSICMNCKQENGVYTATQIQAMKIAETGRFHKKQSEVSCAVPTIEQE